MNRTGSARTEIGSVQCRPTGAWPKLQRRRRNGGRTLPPQTLLTLRNHGARMAETEDKVPPEETQATRPVEKPLGVMLSVPIRSKLGLEPSDHESNTKEVLADPLPSKRARMRRQRW
jgi:hypothetical protein